MIGSFWDNKFHLLPRASFNHHLSLKHLIRNVVRSYNGSEMVIFLFNGKDFFVERVSSCVGVASHDLDFARIGFLEYF